MDRDEATATAEELVRALEAWADGAPGRVEASRRSARSGFLAARPCGTFLPSALPARPGRPYEAERFADHDAARGRRHLTPILRPPPGAQQELYFNTRHFGR